MPSIIAIYVRKKRLQIISRLLISYKYSKMYRQSKFSILYKCEAAPLVQHQTCGAAPERALTAAVAVLHPTLHLEATPPKKSSAAMTQLSCCSAKLTPSSAMGSNGTPAGGRPHIKHIASPAPY